MKKEKEEDWVVNFWVVKRNSRGRVRGYQKEIVVPAKSPQQALKEVVEMVCAKSYIWGEKEKEDKKKIEGKVERNKL